ncbi:hypothetical protein ABTN40_20340, partial [Acinetobacter baumannii]
AVLRALQRARGEVVSLEELGIDAKTDLAWVSSQWRKLVFEESSDGRPPRNAYRHFLELAILQEIRNHLRNGDLFVQLGDKYD